jgi:hypothetical protein
VCVNLFFFLFTCFSLPTGRSSTTVPFGPTDLTPKGRMMLTPMTIIRRGKTLFGSSIIEIKSEYDTLTLCAYSAVDDSAWYSELFHALERVKQTTRDGDRSG